MDIVALKMLVLSGRGMTMGYRENRFASLLIVAVVYILAILLGFYAFYRVQGQIWLKILVADVTATTFVFLFSCILKNASVYDPYWSVQPVAILAPMAINSPSPSKWLLLLMITLWSIRLTSNWAYTFHGLGHQDWRYSQLHQSSGRLYPLVNFLGIHMFPTIVVYLCILPAIYVMIESPAFRPLCLLGFVISVGAATLQLVADTQMHRYRKNRTTPFMEEGLWKYSRHPNYLGEILMWWGVAVYGIVLIGFRWYMVLGAAVNNLMFLFVSIPMADRRQAQKSGYEEYCKDKNRLLPLKFR